MASSAFSPTHIVTEQLREFGCIGSAAGPTQQRDGCGFRAEGVFGTDGHGQLPGHPGGTR
jgi:hypothetical protein